MQRWITVGITCLVVAALVGIGIQQARVDRRASRRETRRHSIGAGPSGMLGQRGFWTGLTSSDSVSCWQEISALESLIEVIPEYAPAHRALSLAYAYAGSSAQAMRAAEQYAALRPEETDIPLLLASVYSLAGYYDRALAELDRVHEIDTLSCWAETMRGDVFLAKGMYGQSLESYRRFVETAPYDLVRSDGLFQIGKLRIEQGRFEEALESFDRSAYPEDSDVRVHLGRGLAFARQGRTDLARAEAIASEEVDGHSLSPGLYEFLIGRILMREKRWEEAAGILGEAASEALVPDRLRCLTALAEACWLAGLPVQARRALDRCLTINPSHAEARYLLARFLEDQGAEGEAITEYEAFLEIWREADPNLPQVQDASRRLGRISHQTSFSE